MQFNAANSNEFLFDPYPFIKYPTPYTEESTYKPDVL